MRETVVVEKIVKSFSPFPVCDRLGVSSLAFAVSFRCRHTVVAVDPSSISVSLWLLVKRFFPHLSVRSFSS